MHEVLGGDDISYTGQPAGDRVTVQTQGHSNHEIRLIPESSSVVFVCPSNIHTKQIKVVWKKKTVPQSMSAGPSAPSD